MAVTFPADKGMTLPPHYLWTREKYERATALGLLGPEDKVELIEGEIVQKMPQNDPHRSAIGAMQEVLGRIFPSGHWICIQLPLALGTKSMPEPDLAVVVGSWRDYTNGAPTAEETRLVVEISDTSLLSDQTAKAAMYARAGIADYWIVNLPERVLEVYRQPGPDDDAPLGHAYRQFKRRTERDTISPLAAPMSVIAVGDLLP